MTESLDPVWYMSVMEAYARDRGGSRGGALEGGHVSLVLMVKEEGFPAIRSACAECGTVESHGCSGLSCWLQGVLSRAYEGCGQEGRLESVTGRPQFKSQLCTL